MILLDVDSVAASRPGRPLFADVSFTISDADRLGIVGLNGSGKSTLLRIIAGIDLPEEGTVRRGRDIGITMLDQDPRFSGMSVREAVTEGHEEAEWEVTAVADRLGTGPHARPTRRAAVGWSGEAGRPGSGARRRSASC